MSMLCVCILAGKVIDDLLTNYVEKKLPASGKSALSSLKGTLSGFCGAYDDFSVTTWHYMLVLSLSRLHKIRLGDTALTHVFEFIRYVRLSYKQFLPFQKHHWSGSGCTQLNTHSLFQNKDHQRRTSMIPSLHWLFVFMAH